MSGWQLALEYYADIFIIAVVESLEKNRAPLPHLEAIYIAVPDETVRMLGKREIGWPWISVESVCIDALRVTVRMILWLWQSCSYCDYYRASKRLSRIFLEISPSTRLCTFSSWRVSYLILAAILLTCWYRMFH